MEIPKDLSQAERDIVRGTMARVRKASGTRQMNGPQGEEYALKGEEEASDLRNFLKKFGEVDPRKK